MKLILIGVSLFCIFLQNLNAQESNLDKLESVKREQAKRIEVIKKISPSVVCIFGNDPALGGGSGVLIHPAGYAVTNFHVVNPVGLKGKGGLNDHQLYELETLGIDPGGDLAVVKLSGKDKFRFAQLKNHRTLSVGDFCMALGNPFLLADDYTPTVTFGVVSGLNRYQYGVGRTLVYGDCIQIDSSINPGNSGGPLFNDDGFVVGINGRGSFEERGRVNVGLGYAISSLQVIKFLPDLFSTKICLHGSLNAKFKTKSDGVICFEINPNGNAFRAGLKAGDKLLSFDGLPIEHSNILVNYVSTYPANWPVKLTIDRQGETKDIWVRLDELGYGENGNEEDESQKKSVFGEIGKIRDLAINSREAERIMGESAALLGFDKQDLTEFSCKVSKIADGKTLEFNLRIKNFHDISVEDLQNSKIYELKALLQQVFLDGVEVKDGFINRQISEVAQPIFQWYLLFNQSKELKRSFVLKGGDLADNRPSFEISLGLDFEEKQAEFIYYFDVMNDRIEFKPKLLKAAILDAGVISNYGFAYKSFTEDTNGLQIPKEILLVRGFEEQEVLRYTVSEVKFK